MKKIIFLFFVFSVKSIAQKGIYLGIASGVNTSFVLDQGLRQDPRYVERLTFKALPVELVTNFNFSQKFGLKAAIGTTNAGQVYDIVNVAKQIAGKREIDLKYLAFSMLVQRLWGNDKTNASAGIGPVLLMMQHGKEVIQWAAGEFNIPKELLPADITPNATGVYKLPTQPEEILASLENTEPYKRFAESQLALSGGFSVNFRLYKKLYWNSNVRISYNFTDTRGKDLISNIKNGTIKDLLGHRSNVLVGAVGGIILKL